MSTQLEMIQIVLQRESLRKQLEEYELLKSIYSMPGEFHTDSPYLVSDIQEYLSGNRPMINEKLDFRIKVQLTDKVKMELSIMLGQLYPTLDPPTFIIRTDTLSKTQETLVKRAIEKFIETEVDKTEPYIYQIISWLQDNLDKIVKQKKEAIDEDLEEMQPEKLQRVWVWSHHIYSKIKRQNIIKLCKNGEISGFMWPGKPGVICLEGTADNTEEVIRNIKSWQWQKIKIVKVETRENDVDGKFYRFNGFEEILTGNGDDGEAVKMDTGRFFKYLDTHNSGYMKMEIFGFD